MTQQDATQVARELTAALDRMSAELAAVQAGSEERDAALAAYGQRNRRLIWATIASVVLDVVLTVVVGLVAIQAHHASIAARHASASNYALCQAGNVARSQQVHLWEFVISLPPAHPPTAQQRKNVVAFEAHLHQIFKPRDCAAFGRAKN